MTESLRNEIRKVRRLINFGDEPESAIEKRTLELIKDDLGYVPERFQRPAHAASEIDQRVFELTSYERGYLAEALSSRLLNGRGDLVFEDTRSAEEQAREEVFAWRDATAMLLGRFISEAPAAPGKLRETLIRDKGIERLSRVDLYAELYDSIRQMEEDGIKNFLGVIRFAKAYRNADLSLHVNELATKGAAQKENLDAGPEGKRNLSAKRRAFVRVERDLLLKKKTDRRFEGPQTVARELIERHQLMKKLTRNKLLDKKKKLNIRTISGYLVD